MFSIIQSKVQLMGGGVGGSLEGYLEGVYDGRDRGGRVGGSLEGTYPVGAPSSLVVSLDTAAV